MKRTNRLISLMVGVLLVTMLSGCEGKMPMAGGAEDVTEVPVVETPVQSINPDDPFGLDAITEDVQEDPMDKYAMMEESTPKGAVNKFLLMIKNSDFDLAYSMLYIPEDLMFNNRGDFDWYLMKSPVGRLKDGDTQITALDTTLDGSTRDVKLRLTIAGKNVNFEMKTTLDKENKWKMVMLDMYTYDWLLEVPNGLVVTYGEEKDDIGRFRETSNDAVTVYKIPIISQREHTFMVQSLFGEHETVITPIVDPKSKTNMRLDVEIDGVILSDALVGSQDILNAMNSAMSKGSDMSTISELVDYRVVMENMSEMYKTGIRQRERYRESGGTSISRVIKNPNGKARLIGWDILELDIGIYMNMSDENRGPVEMRLYTTIQLSNIEDVWQYYGGDSKLFTYVNGNTKNF